MLHFNKYFYLNSRLHLIERGHIINEEQDNT